jgi:hypothetical protein
MSASLPCFLSLLHLTTVTSFAKSTDARPTTCQYFFSTLRRLNPNVSTSDSLLALSISTDFIEDVYHGLETLAGRE